MSNPNPPAPPVRVARWQRWLAWALLAGYGVFLARHSAVVAGGSDSSGYLNSARLLAGGQLLTDLRAPAEFGPREKLNAFHFLPQGFFPVATPGKLTPTYPSGLPLHLALAGKLLGWRAGPFVVMLGGALGALVLSYAIARELGLDAALAVTAVVLLAAFPVFIFTSVQPLSDTLATTWILLACLFALRAARGAGKPFACGFAFAMAVLVRPTNLLLAPAVLVLLGLSWRRLAWFALGGVPGAAWLAFYDHQLYGSVFRTGYGNIYDAFALSYGAPTALHFTKWLALLLPAVVLVLPWAALTHARTRTRPLLGLALAFATLAGTYAFYEVSHEVWWCLRFILPVIPALILMSLLGVDALARRGAEATARRIRLGFAVVASGWAVALSWHWTPKLSVLLMKQFEEAYAKGSLAARDRLPADAVVMSFAFSGALYFYTDFPVIRWDQVDAATFARYAQLAQARHRPVCAVLFEAEEKDAFQKCPGAWTRLARVGNVGLWRLGPPQT